MKRFILNVTYFSAFVLILMSIIEIVTPSEFTTYRSWEALKAESKGMFIGPFYPNKNVRRNEYGDLAHHTKYEVLKKDVYWQTDALGFRNKEVIDQPDLVFLGQSNIAGCSVSQNENISSQVSKISGLSSYNMAPYSFPEFTRLLDQGIIKKPKVVVFGLVERMLPYLDPSQIEAKNSWVKNNYLKLKKTGPFQNLAIIIDRISKKSLQHFTTARVNNSTGRGFQSSINPKMFFFQGEEAKIEVNTNTIESSAEVIDLYRAYCQKRGIEFIFLPVPNKETIYYEQVPFKEQPIFFRKIIYRIGKTQNQHCKYSKNI